MKKTSTMKSLNGVLNVLRSAFAVMLLLIGVGAAASASAQTSTITGKVTCKGEPVIGASVVVAATGAGVSTDLGGNFSIKAAGNAVLNVSAIGYASVDVNVNNRTAIDIELQEDAIAIGEAVVVGYGVQKKVNVTGAVSSISTKELEGKPIVNAIEGLQGTSPGLIIQQGSSTPGGAPSLNIRGLNTMNNNDPLVLIDGIESSLANVNPNDIDQISILKDASSTAIYGSRASNGVILVTTKKGSEGHTEVNYNMTYGLQTPTALPDVVDSWIYAELYNEAAVNSGLSPKFSAEQIAAFRNGGTNCKWINEIYKSKASQQSHNFSVTGGNQQLTYMGSFGYTNQNSLFQGPNYGFERYNGRVNVNHKIAKTFSVGVTTQFTRNNIKDHAYWTEWIIEMCNRMPSIYEIKNPDGTYNYPSGSNSNSLERLEKGGFRRSTNDDFSGTINADWDIYKGLKLTGNMGIRLLNNSTHENRYASESPISGDKEDHIYEYSFRSRKLTSNLILSYNNTWGKHTLGAMAGFSYEGYSDKFFETTRITEDHKFDVLVGGQSGDKISNAGGAGDWSLYSVFGRLNYNYDEKYLFEFNIRNDYSSYFAKGNRSGVFPSVSAGWRISREDFFENALDYVSDLKLRASYGLVGNNRIGAYQYMQTATTTMGMTFGDQQVPTVGFSAVDPAIKWETTAMLNVGLEIGFLKNSLNFAFDYFNNKTSDILVKLSVPGIFGNEAPTTNAASVRTQGWEASVNYNFKTGPVKHTLTANLSDNWNKVIDTKGAELFYGYDVVSIIKEGYPLYSYYSVRSNGFFQSDEEAANSPHLVGVTPKAGDIRYIDKNGDGYIDDQDRFVNGSDFPRYTYGFKYGLEVKGFFASIFLQGVGKRTRWMRGESVEAFHNNNEGPVLGFHVDRWTPNNPKASYPRMTMGSENTNNAYKSDFWLCDASYLRIKNVQVGYNFPEHLLRKAHIKALQVYFSIENAATFSNMKGGWDPEYNADGSGRAYPVARVFSFGAGIKF